MADPVKKKEAPEQAGSDYSHRPSQREKAGTPEEERIRRRERAHLLRAKNRARSRKK